jgi:hypothetical protein
MSSFVEQRTIHLTAMGLYHSMPGWCCQKQVQALAAATVELDRYTNMAACLFGVGECVKSSDASPAVWRTEQQNR